MLVFGIAYHIVFMAGLRRERELMKADGLTHAESVYPLSMTLMTAMLLLVIGVLAITSIAFGIGPFE
jgi:putative membrane protein